MTTVILVPCCLLGASAQLDWMFLQFPEMPAKHLDFPSLSLTRMGSMCSGCPFTVQMARYETAFLALWDHQQLCFLLLPCYCKEGVGKTWVQVFALVASWLIYSAV